MVNSGRCGNDDGPAWWSWIEQGRTAAHNGDVDGSVAGEVFHETDQVVELLTGKRPELDNIVLGLGGPVCWHRGFEIGHRVREPPQQWLDTCDAKVCLFKDCVGLGF